MADFPEHNNLMGQLNDLDLARTKRYMSSLEKINRQGYGRIGARQGEEALKISDAVPRRQ